jgi:low temperature requirement protein LtrA
MNQEARPRAEPTIFDGIKITVAGALLVASLFALLGSLDAQSTLERVQRLFAGLGVGAIMPVTFLFSQLFLLPPRAKPLAHRQRRRKSSATAAQTHD